MKGKRCFIKKVNLWPKSKRELLGFLFMISCFLVIFFLVFFCFFLKLKENIGWYTNQTLIGHAFYGIDENTYTNSYEALEAGYQKGIRVMEVDLAFTSDQELVLVHDWYENTVFQERVTYQRFMASKIYDKYTPMDLAMLFSAMKKYSDLYIVVDSKEEFWSDYQLVSVYEKLVSECQKVDASLLDRFIVQLYDFDDYQSIQDVYPFSSYIFSLYQMPSVPVKRVVYYCLWYQIDTIAIPLDYVNYGLVTKEDIIFMKGKNLKVFIYTVNEQDIYDEYMKLGIDGVYTDYLSTVNDLIS